MQGIIKDKNKIVWSWIVGILLAAALAIAASVAIPDQDEITPADADSIPFYDDSGSVGGRVTFTNFWSYISGKITTLLGAAYDTEAELDALFTARVDTSGTPVDNDIAMFTDANTVEGRSFSEHATDMESANEAVMDLEDMQGAVTDGQVPDNITITESDPNVDSSTEIVAILNTTPSTKIDEEVIQQAGENCLSSEPGSPVAGRLYCADGDNWQIDSDRQGTDDWIAYYANSSWVAIFNITDGTRIEGEKCFVIPNIYAQPDSLQAETDAWPIMHFPAEMFPDGFEVTSIQISTSATCTDTVNIEEWSNTGTAWSTTSTVESITLSGTFTEDDGTLSDSTIAADSWLFADLDDSATDISYMTITICGY